MGFVSGEEVVCVLQAPRSMLLLEQASPRSIRNGEFLWRALHRNHNYLQISNHHSPLPAHYSLLLALFTLHGPRLLGDGIGVCLRLLRHWPERS
jgi:hypothetical protein